MGEPPTDAAATRRMWESLEFRALLWINGEWCKAEDGRTFSVEDKATGEVIENVAMATDVETRKAVSAACDALPGWRRCPPAERSQFLQKILALLHEYKEPLARLITVEQGSPLDQSRSQVDYAASFFSWFAGEAQRIYGRSVPHPDPRRRLRVEYYPVGVVAAITPWNGALGLPAKKIAGALAAGCTIILKPSELTPLSALALAWLSQKAGLPSGVFNVVCGDAPAIGRVLLHDPDVRMITFTGSTRTGRCLMTEAAKQIKRISLELGGNAPFIVFSDADMNQAAEDLVWLKCMNSGQVCVTANRILVEENIQAEFVAKVLEHLRQQKLGHGLSPGVTVGPLIRREAVERIASLVQEAIKQGANLRYGGDIPPPGPGERFFPPTLLENVTQAMRLAREEIFGPVFPVLTFESDDEALQMANDTSYGLAAYVYTNNIARGQRFAEELEVGVVGINDPRPIIASAPFGGCKESGIGREGGTEGLLEFMEPRLIGTRFPENRFKSKSNPGSSEK